MRPSPLSGQVSKRITNDFRLKLATCYTNYKRRVGKLPGLALRLSLVLAYLDWVAGADLEPHEITVAHFGPAAHFIEAYALPMARRAYADASWSKAERAARRLLALIREQGWKRFTSREVQRLDRSGLTTVAELKPALTALEEADVIRSIEGEASPRGGRPTRLFAVNPTAVSGATGEALRDRFDTWEERAAIREYDGGQPREAAEREAAREVGLNVEYLPRRW